MTDVEELRRTRARSFRDRTNRIENNNVPMKDRKRKFRHSRKRRKEGRRAKVQKAMKKDKKVQDTILGVTSEKKYRLV